MLEHKLIMMALRPFAALLMFAAGFGGFYVGHLIANGLERLFRWRLTTQEQPVEARA
jgi:hypothetical protein